MNSNRGSRNDNSCSSKGSSRNTRDEKEELGSHSSSSVPQACNFKKQHTLDPYHLTPSPAEVAVESAMRLI